MIYGAKAICKYILGTDQAGRNFRVYPDDTFVVSYAQSGNLWTRFLVANLVHPNLEVRLSNIERLVPDTSSQSNRALLNTPRPRFIKSHQYFDRRYRQVIYIVRDLAMWRSPITISKEDTARFAMTIRWRAMSKTMSTGRLGRQSGVRGRRMLRAG